MEVFAVREKIDLGKSEKDSLHPIEKNPFGMDELMNYSAAENIAEHRRAVSSALTLYSILHAFKY